VLNKHHYLVVIDVLPIKNNAVFLTLTVLFLGFDVVSIKLPNLAGISKKMLLAFHGQTGVSDHGCFDTSELSVMREFIKSNEMKSYEKGIELRQKELLDSL